jgi:hypothetical protein
LLVTRAFFACLFSPPLDLLSNPPPRSFGYYVAILPAFLNLVSFIVRFHFSSLHASLSCSSPPHNIDALRLQGFCAVNAMVAGQVLAAVNPGGLSTTAGIVIVAVVSMGISFCGYKVLHHVERWAWLPVILSFILLAGFGSRHLGAATSFASEAPATAANVLSFLSIIVGFTISWSGCSADFNTYMKYAPFLSVRLFPIFQCLPFSLTGPTSPLPLSPSTPSSVSTFPASSSRSWALLSPPPR